MFLHSFAYICAYDFTFSNMDNIQRQRGNIEPHKEQKADGDHIRTEYAGNGEIPLLPSQDTGVEIAGNDSACIAAIPFKLSDFYDRYSPHAHIDHSRAYVRHPQPKREHRLPKGYPELMKELPRYFREYRPKKWLFEGETPGQPYSASALAKALKKATQRAGIKHRAHAHSLPHSFATHLWKQGTDLHTIQVSAHKANISNPLDTLDDS